jgi:hypothetical protein
VSVVICVDADGGVGVFAVEPERGEEEECRGAKKRARRDRVAELGAIAAAAMSSGMCSSSLQFLQPAI